MADNTLNTIRERAAGSNSELQLNTYGLLGSDGRLTWSRGTASLNIDGCIRVTGNGGEIDTVFSGSIDPNLLTIHGDEDKIGIGTSEPEVM